MAMGHGEQIRCVMGQKSKTPTNHISIKGVIDYLNHH